MKKVLSILSLLLVACMLLSLAACGGKIPKGMNKETYELGKRALTIIEKYHSVEMTGEEARTAADELLKRLGNIHDDSAATSLSIYLRSFSWDILTGGDTYEDEVKIKNILGIK